MKHTLNPHIELVRAILKESLDDYYLRFHKDYKDAKRLISLGVPRTKLRDQLMKIYAICEDGKQFLFSTRLDNLLYTYGFDCDALPNYIRRKAPEYTPVKEEYATKGAGPIGGIL